MLANRLLRPFELGHEGREQELFKPRQSGCALLATADDCELLAKNRISRSFSSMGCRRHGGCRAKRQEQVKGIPEHRKHHNRFERSEGVILPDEISYVTGVTRERIRFSHHTAFFTWEERILEYCTQSRFGFIATTGLRRSSGIIHGKFVSPTSKSAQ